MCRIVILSLTNGSSANFDRSESEVLGTPTKLKNRWRFRKVCGAGGIHKYSFKRQRLETSNHSSVMAQCVIKPEE